MVLFTCILFLEEIMNRENLDARIKVLIGKMLDGTITDVERSEFHHLQADLSAHFRIKLCDRLLRAYRTKVRTRRGYC